MACEEKMAALMAKVGSVKEELEVEASKIGEEARKRAKEINPDLDTTGPDAYIGIDFDIEWKRTDIKLDLPQVKMVDQKIALDLPEVTMGEQRISFDVPEVRMVPTKVGQYPEFYCDGPFDCRVRWSDIITDMPVTDMVRKEIVVSLPEFTMKRNDMVIGVPEFWMDTQTIALDLPEIKVKNIRAEADIAAEKGRQLAADTTAKVEGMKSSFRERAKMNLGFEVSALFDCYHADMNEKKATAMTKFAEGTRMMEGAIAGMVSAKAPEDSEALVTLRGNLASLIAKRDEFITNITKQFEDLDNRRKTFVDNMLA